MSSIDKLHAEPEYNEFFRNYLLSNRPCVLPSSITSEWRSGMEWVSAGGSPNFTTLRRLFGSAVVPVADCHQEQYSAHPKTDMKMADYLDYWENYRASGHQSCNKSLYLKDWHLTKAFPDYKAYTTPTCFLSDWLNEFWDSKSDDDYRFVYMGPKGTWTPFHSDVYRSYSWSANICGRKRWIFFPPGDEDILRDKFGQLVYNVNSEELMDQSKFPHYTKVKDKRLEVIQEQGEILFVPSGWHHQVYNMEDTISINHNWLNGCNIMISWEYLKRNLISVQHEIEDCKDMEGWSNQCQLILNASAGIDYVTIYNLISLIGERRLNWLCVKGSRCYTGTQTDTVQISGLGISDRPQSDREDTSVTANPEMQQEHNDILQHGTDVCEALGKTEPIVCNSSVDCLRDSESMLYSKVQAHSMTGDVVSDCQTSCIAESTQMFNRQTDVSPVPDKMVISNSVCTPRVSLSEEHVVYDLLKVRQVLKDMLDNTDFKEIDYSVFVTDPVLLLEKLDSFLHEYIASPDQT